MNRRGMGFTVLIAMVMWGEIGTVWAGDAACPFRKVRPLMKISAQHSLRNSGVWKRSEWSLLERRESM